jgi:hypothetical protein
MFIVALFIIARKWQQPRCPSSKDWIKNMRYIYKREYYSALKRNSSMKFKGTRKKHPE